MDAAQITITTTDVAAGFGSSFFYSSVAVVAMAEMVLVSAMAVADVVVVITTAIAANGSLSFLFSSAAAETMVPAANFFTGIVFTVPSYIVNTRFVTDFEIELLITTNINYKEQTYAKL